MGNVFRCPEYPEPERSHGVGIVIYRLYEWIVLRGIGILPAHICFMITGDDLRNAPDKLALVAQWCGEVNRYLDGHAALPDDRTANRAIRGVTVHVSTPNPEEIVPFLPSIREVSTYAGLILHVGEYQEGAGEGIAFEVAIGKSGRDEIVSCIRTMATEGLMAEEVNEQTLEHCLTFRYTPDLVIKTGGYHLTDFLIWQSVYSELFFSDVNWRLFRKIDFLRALRDYQGRVRRFGT
jgi:undecaprenyl diphosphate synthase